MSKVDAQRAMREAKYARLRASGPTRREEAAARGTAGEPEPREPEARPVRATRAKAPRTTAEETVTAGPAPAVADALCGHQSISGRTCTRGAGHPQKSHRYG